jgi:large subunit ribosomal protein L17
MTKPTKGPRLGHSPSHEKKILMNLTKDILEQNHVTTTITKAKRVRPVVEKMITLGKKALKNPEKSLHYRRLALKFISDKGIIEKLFTEIAELFKDRNGGYTRITRIGIRKGDNATLAVIELVGGLDLTDNRPGQPVALPEDEDTDTETDVNEADSNATETDAPESDAPEPEAEETPAPETDAPESEDKPAEEE